MAAHTHIAEQGLSLVPVYTGRDAAESGAELHCWTGAVPGLGVQPNRSETRRLYGFYESFLKKVKSVRVEPGPKFRLGQSNKNCSLVCS